MHAHRLSRSMVAVLADAEEEQERRSCARAWAGWAERGLAASRPV